MISSPSPVMSDQVGMEPAFVSVTEITLGPDPDDPLPVYLTTI
jgi:hypothetical protein